MPKSALRLTNRRVRLLVGLLVAGLLFAHLSGQMEARPRSAEAYALADETVHLADRDLQSRMERWAATDHVKLLELCLEHYRRNIHDYRCTFTKQERIGGTLRGAQEMAVKFLHEPFSVAMRWTRNAPVGDRILYVDGKYAGDMLIHLKSGFLRAVAGDPVRRKPDCAEAMKKTRRPVTMFGFENALQSLLEVYRAAADSGDLSQSFEGYFEMAGRKTIKLCRVLPPKEGYPAHRTFVYVDLEHLVPICIEAHDWKGKLTSQYRYSDVQFNVGLRPADFEPEACGIARP